MKETLEQHSFCQKTTGELCMYNNYIDYLFYECLFPKVDLASHSKQNPAVLQLLLLIQFF